MDAKTWQQAKQWLIDAMALPEPERQAFLAQRCPDKAVQRELLEMLASDATLSGVVTTSTLRTGTRLGPYEIDTVIGAGGMGEVYRAHDARLGRDVAIKVLPVLFASDRDRLARFEREAKLLASLNHPHICTLFDVGRESSTDYIVMEFVDGELLSDRLRTGPLALDKALAYAIEIADALDKAHGLGIVHRDLKPGNIMVTKSGTKLLDFGLARSTQAPRDVTKTGTVLGTLRYMSPEQLKGAEADSRSDVWAFGCVLYQMLAGRTPFDSPSEAAIGAAILETEPPPLSLVVRGVPPSLQRVVDRCLAKAPDDRWQSIADLRHELEWIAKLAGKAPESGGQPAVFTRRERLAWAAASVAIVIAVAAVSFIAWNARHMPAPVFRRLSLALPEALEEAGSFALSRDGLKVAFIGKPRDSTEPSLIWVQPLTGDADAQPLAATAGGRLPFWSSDGRRLGFFADGKLKTIDLETGSVSVLCPAPVPRGGTWAGNTILFVPHQHAGVHRLDIGGQPVALTHPRGDDDMHRFPAFLGDGVHFVFTVVADGVVHVNLGSLADPAITELHHHDSEGIGRGLTQAYVAHGFLVFAFHQSLMARAFDEKRLRLSGDEVLVAKGVDGDAVGTQAFAVSDSTVIYRSSQGRVPSQLTWLSTSGDPVGKPIWDPAVFQSAQLSPDDTQAVVARSDGSQLILWAIDFARDGKQSLTVGSPSVVWALAGDRVFFRKPGKVWHDKIYSILVDGRDERLEVDQPDDVKSPLGWSDTGSLLYSVPGKLSGTLWELPPHTKTGVPVRPEEANTDFSDADVTRRGDLIASVVGRSALYVQPLRSGPRTLVATGQISSPRWRADGHELYFLSGGHMMAAEVPGGNPVKVLPPHRLFDFHGSIFSPSRDGKRFLVAVPRSSGTPPVNIVLNWTSPHPK